MSDQLPPIDYDPTDFDDGLADDFEDRGDCGWKDEGGCSMAGSKECFECPNRDLMMAELDRTKRKR